MNSPTDAAEAIAPVTPPIVSPHEEAIGAKRHIPYPSSEQEADAIAAYHALHEARAIAGSVSDSRLSDREAANREVKSSEADFAAETRRVANAVRVCKAMEDRMTSVRANLARMSADAATAREAAIESTNATARSIAASRAARDAREARLAMTTNTIAYENARAAEIKAVKEAEEAGHIAAFALSSASDKAYWVTVNSKIVHDAEVAYATASENVRTTQAAASAAAERVTAATARADEAARLFTIASRRHTDLYLHSGLDSDDDRDCEPGRCKCMGPNALLCSAGMVPVAKKRTWDHLIERIYHFPRVPVNYLLLPTLRIYKGRHIVDNPVDPRYNGPCTPKNTSNMGEYLRRVSVLPDGAKRVFEQEFQREVGIELTDYIIAYDDYRFRHQLNRSNCKDIIYGAPALL